MRKRTNIVPVILKPEQVKRLPEKEIRAILRGADDLAARGGRSLLTKIVKGSRDKKLLEFGLDKNPAYGYFKAFPAETVTAKIDWCIEHHYLSIEYDGRLPLIVFTEIGWEIERENLLEEMLNMLKNCAKTGDYSYTRELKDKNREVILELLDRIASSGDKCLIPILEYWRDFDYKKVQAAIGRTIRELGK